MAKAPAKKPAAPGSIAPQGPTNPAATLYPPMSGKVPVSAAKPGAQMIGAPQTATNGRVVTKGAVPVKEAKNLPGNQGTKNSHTKPTAIKSNGSAAKVDAQIDHVVSTTALKGPASKVYPHLTRR